MDDELPCQSSIDKLHGKTFGFIVSPYHNLVEESVCDEVIIFRCKYDGKEQLLEEERHDAVHDGYELN